MSELLKSMSDLLPGLWMSLQMGAAALAVGIPLGFLAGMGIAGRRKVLRRVLIGFVEVFRGFPALVVLYLVYFGLVEIVTLGRFAATVIAFGLTVSAYTAEIFRAAIENVPKGQLEAAEALSFTARQTTVKVIIPHVVTIVAAPITGIAIIAFQGTSLAYAIGAKELLGTAYSIGMVDFNMLPQLIMAAVLYLLVTTGMTWMEMMADRRASIIAGRSFKKSKRWFRGAATSQIS